MDCEVLIFGGGISGIWLLAQLRSHGIGACLLESAAVGGGQTGFSQGIIHSGLKYTVAKGEFVGEGFINKAHDMPRVWERAVLRYKGRVLAPETMNSCILLFCFPKTHPQTLRLKPASILFRLLRRTKTLEAMSDDLPTVLPTYGFEGRAFPVEELVVDVQKVLEYQFRKLTPLCKGIGWPESVAFCVESNKVTAVSIGSIEINPKFIVVLAGAGNQEIAARMGVQLEQVRKPLRMAALFPMEHDLYAHFFEPQLADAPMLTITTHRQKGQRLWYLGGEVAERGIKQDEKEFREGIRERLEGYLPGLDFNSKSLRSFVVNRFEPPGDHAVMRRHASPSVSMIFENVLVGWPLKLCLAPYLAYDITTRIKRKLGTRSEIDVSKLADPRLALLPAPALAEPNWASAPATS